MIYPPFFFATIALLGVLLCEATFKLALPWAVPAIMVYFTIAGWYVFDVFVTPEGYDQLSHELLDDSYFQVALFLLVFRAALSWAAKNIVAFGHPERAVSRGSRLTPETLFVCVALLWMGLLAIGTIRMEGHLSDALFPWDSRGGVSMWQRGALGEAVSAAFLVSTAAYLYCLTCGLFGVLCFLPGRQQLLSGALWIVSLPYFILSGTRSTLLAVIMPGIFSFVLLSRSTRMVKCVGIIAAFFLLHTGLKIIVTFRNVGFREFIENKEFAALLQEAGPHRGLNMIQELCFINEAISTRAIVPTWGVGYMSELANAVPRALWPNKPILGLEYAIFRGFADARGERDIGITATISNGVIGGGIMNFGQRFGAVAPALFMAFWCGLLARWWTQRASCLRACLFLAGLGITFNLGRDLTLLVAWPVVFGYALTRLAEFLLPRPREARFPDSQPSEAQSLSSPLAGVRE